MNRLVLAAAGMLAFAAAAHAQSEVIARRGDAALTFADVDVRMGEIPADKREGFIDSPERIETMVNQLLLLKQIAAEARSAGLDKDPGYLAKLALAQDRLLAETQMEKIARAETGVDAEAIAKETYVSDPARFASPATRTVRHVLIKSDCACDRAAKARAEDVRKRAEAGESFESLVAKLSEDEGSKAQGGRIEVLPANNLDPVFREAANALTRPGEISPVVHSEFGFHVLQLVAIHPGKKQSFEAVRDQLVAEVVASERGREMREHNEALQNLRIEADPEAILALRTRYPKGVIPGTVAPKAN